MQKAPALPGLSHRAFPQARSDELFSPAVIAGLDPAIPIMWHGRALVSGLAGSSPAMTQVDRTGSGARRHQNL
jgi:hypothetical protein